MGAGVGRRTAKVWETERDLLGPWTEGEGFTPKYLPFPTSRRLIGSGLRCNREGYIAPRDGLIEGPRADWASVRRSNHYVRQGYYGVSPSARTFAGSSPACRPRSPLLRTRDLVRVATYAARLPPVWVGRTGVGVYERWKLSVVGSGRPKRVGLVEGEPFVFKVVSVLLYFATGKRGSTTGNYAILKSESWCKACGIVCSSARILRDLPRAPSSPTFSKVKRKRVRLRRDSKV